jgi:dienelactone hydrolase
MAAGVTALRVRYRHPADLAESTLDVLAGLYFLDGLGVQRVALVGHSFGGAVVVQAAANVEFAAAVVALSTQSAGVEPASELPPGCASLFVHGEADEVLSPACSRLAYRLAPEPKRLSLYPQARHGLDEAAGLVHVEVRDWILRHLGTRGD